MPKDYIIKKLKMTVTVLAILTFVGFSVWFGYLIQYNQDILYFNKITCFFLVFWALAILCYFDISWKKKAIWFLFSIGVASGLWLWLSYDAYYNGARMGSISDAVTHYKAISAILHDSKLNIEERKVSIDDYLKKLFQRKVKIVISNIATGEVLIENEFSSDVSKNYEIIQLPYAGTLMEKYGGEWRDHINDLDDIEASRFPVVHTDDGVYNLKYYYADRPYWTCGLSRAILISAWDDEASDEHFITKRNYSRSTHFHLVFIPLLIITLMYSDNKKKIEVKNAELKKKNEELVLLLGQKEEAYNKMAEALQEREAALNKLEVFRITLDKMRSDFNNNIKASQNNLQTTQSEWDYITKKIARAERHDYKNDLATLKKLVFQSKGASQEKEEAFISLLKNLQLECNFDLVNVIYELYLEGSL